MGKAPEDLASWGFLVAQGVPRSTKYLSVLLVLSGWIQFFRLNDVLTDPRVTLVVTTRGSQLLSTPLDYLLFQCCFAGSV